MSREQLVAMARREVDNLQANKIDLAPDVYRVPASLYVDRERWQKEVDRIFKRIPLALGFSCELREPGSYRAIEVMDTPVLIVRGEDGEEAGLIGIPDIQTKAACGPLLFGLTGVVRNACCYK